MNVVADKMLFDSAASVQASVGRQLGENAATIQNSTLKKVAVIENPSDALILKWANRVDLSRVKGIGEEYSDLLEASGVDTVPELAKRNAANLYAKMLEVNGFERRVRKLPTEAQVAAWVTEAATLPRMLEY